MGRRYKAILEHIGIAYDEFDAGDWGLARETVGITGVIITSPTDCHLENLKHFKGMDLPILCEKPLTKCKYELQEILDLGLKLTMVNQYAYIDGVKGEFKDTYYDYYNTGNDGIEWDCINIIGLAEKKPTINNRSPDWKCQINGEKLTLERVNTAYVVMINDWVNNPTPNTEYIIEAHKKVMDGFYVKGTDCNSSKDEQQQTAWKMQHGDKRQDDARMGSRSGPTFGSVHQQGKQGTYSERSASSTDGGQTLKPVFTSERPGHS